MAFRKLTPDEWNQRNNPAPDPTAPQGDSAAPSPTTGVGSQVVTGLGGQAASFGKSYAKELAGEAGSQPENQPQWAARLGVPNVGRMVKGWADAPDKEPNTGAQWLGRRAEDVTPYFLPMGTLGRVAGLAERGGGEFMATSLGKTVKGITDKLSPDMQYVGPVVQTAQEMWKSGKSFTQAEWTKAGLDPELWTWATEQPSRFHDWLATKIHPETADRIVQSIVKGAQKVGRAASWPVRGAAGGADVNPQNPNAGASTGAVGATVAGAANVPFSMIKSPWWRAGARSLPLAGILAAYEMMKTGHKEYIPWWMYHVLSTSLPAVASAAGGIAGNPILSGALSEEGAVEAGYDQPQQQK